MTGQIYTIENSIVCATQNYTAEIEEYTIWVNNLMYEMEDIKNAVVHAGQSHAAKTRKLQDDAAELQQSKEKWLLSYKP